jgi:fimbrial isopeptide formation D2 family protein
VNDLRKKVIQLFLVFSSLLLFVLATEADAAEKNIKEWNKTEIASDNVYAPARFSVVPQFVSGQTVIRTFGKDFEITTQNSNGNYAGFTVRNPSNSDKGKFGVYYDKIASYQGRDLTLKVTVMDWSGYNTVGYQILSFGRLAIGFTQTGFNWVDLKWEYYYTDTKEKAIDIDGSYMNVIDIDAVQGVQFDKETTAKIEKVYVTDNTWIKYAESAGQVHFFESNDLSSNNEDEFAMFTVLFNEGHTFRFRWTKDYAARGTRPNAVYGDGFGGNEFFGFNGQKLIRTEVLEPYKFIQSGDDLLSESVLSSIKDELTYEVYHTVPDEIPRFHYKSYAMIDEVPAGLGIRKVEIYNHAGTDVSNLFYVSVEKNVVEIKAKPSALSNRSFYNTTYRTVITTKIEDLPLLEQSLEENSNVANLINTATLIIDSKSNTTDEVITKVYRRKIIVDHIDEKTEELLKQEIEYKFDGETYSYRPFTDLENSDGNLYKSIVTHRGTVDGKDLSFVTPYYIPSLNVNVESIQIDTSKAEKNGGLPTRLTLTQEAEYKEDLSNLRFVIEIIEKETNRVVYEKELTVTDEIKVLELLLPTDALGKAEKVDYLVSIKAASNPDKNKFVTDTKDLATHGYTATEKVLTNQDLSDSVVDYKAVARTLRLREEESVQEFNESIQYEFNQIVRSKTGYGFEIDLDPLFSSEVLDVVNSLELKLIAPKDLVESHIQEEFSSDSQSVMIPLEQTNFLSRASDTRADSLLSFAFPEVQVERITGNLYTQNQAKNNRSKTQHELIDGGRNFYLPIWLELGDYAVTLSSNTVGRNHIQLEMTKTIDVFAYMYATMDSETKELDELLLTPVFPETDAPVSWSDDEIAWLEGA